MHVYVFLGISHINTKWIVKVSTLAQADGTNHLRSQVKCSDQPND